MTDFDFVKTHDAPGGFLPLDCAFRDVRPISLDSAFCRPLLETVPKRDYASFRACAMWTDLRTIEADGLARNHILHHTSVYQDSLIATCSLTRLDAGLQRSPVSAIQRHSLKTTEAI